MLLLGHILNLQSLDIRRHGFQTDGIYNFFLGAGSERVHIFDGRVISLTPSLSFQYPPHCDLAIKIIAQKISLSNTRLAHIHGKFWFNNVPVEEALIRILKLDGANLMEILKYTDTPPLDAMDRKLVCQTPLRPFCVKAYCLSLHIGLFCYLVCFFSSP